MFQKLYVKFDQNIFLFQLYLKHFRPGVGIPGPISFSPNRADPILTEPDPGPIGIGLALSNLSIFSI